MSIKQVWLNLPVKDIKKSKEFFNQIGFIPNPMHDKAEHLGSFIIGENKFVLMLFPENIFKGFINHSISDTKIGTEMLINFDAESKEEVDMMAEKVRQAGDYICRARGLPGLDVCFWFYRSGWS